MPSKTSDNTITSSVATQISAAVSSDNPPSLQEISGAQWTALSKQECSFPPEIFRSVMLNLIRNPNINSSHLFRADISLDVPFDPAVSQYGTEIPSRIIEFQDFVLKNIMVRTLIPRNPIVDKPLDQTCMFFENFTASGKVYSLVVYHSHIASAIESPFYHPAVRGIGFLHEYDPIAQHGEISISYQFFDSEPRSPKHDRTAQRLLAVLAKHGKGSAAGYVKRVNHDVVLPQMKVQNTYARLKVKYGRQLCEKWIETTDPTKHVFEDLAIAAFLIELWADVYKDQVFPGFVDIGCGNGLLVHILVEEGYPGWGFDARRRKSWEIWSPKAQKNLKEMILIPAMLQTSGDTAKDDQGNFLNDAKIHNGIFPSGTFIISNHADELTPWTPILANISRSFFIMIPCCSHALSGAKFRAPPPKKAGASQSQFASLVAWVSKVAEECGWLVEKEMLRIPSTRNTAIIGRTRIIEFEGVHVEDVVAEHGGAYGWAENSLKLVKGAMRGH